MIAGAHMVILHRLRLPGMLRTKDLEVGRMVLRRLRDGTCINDRVAGAAGVSILSECFLLSAHPYMDQQIERPLIRDDLAVSGERRLLHHLHLEPVMEGRSPAAARLGLTGNLLRLPIQLPAPSRTVWT